MTKVDRGGCSGWCQAVGGAGPAGQEGSVCYSFTACVRCPFPDERLVGGIRRKPTPPSVRVLPRPDRWRQDRR